MVWYGDDYGKELGLPPMPPPGMLPSVYIIHAKTNKPWDSSHFTYLFVFIPKNATVQTC